MMIVCLILKFLLCLDSQSMMAMNAMMSMINSMQANGQSISAEAVNIMNLF